MTRAETGRHLVATCLAVTWLTAGCAEPSKAPPPPSTMTRARDAGTTAPLPDAHVPETPPSVSCEPREVLIAVDLSVRARKISAVGVEGGFVVAWAQRDPDVDVPIDEGATSSVRDSVQTTFIAADGTVGATNVVSAAEGAVRSPRVTNALVAWQAEGSSGFDLHAQPVSWCGVPEGEPFELAVSEADERELGLALLPTGHVSVFARRTSDGWALFAQTVSMGLRPLDPIQLTETTSYLRPAVASTLTGALVAWVDDASNVQVQPLDSSGRPTGDRQLAYDGGEASGLSEIAFGGSNGVVVFDIAHGPSRRVAMRRIDREGRATGPVEHVSEIGEHAVGGGVAAFHGGYLVAYRGYRMGSEEQPGVVVRLIDGGDGACVHRQWLEAAGLEDGAPSVAVSSEGTALVVWAAINVEAGMTTIRGAHIDCPELGMGCAVP